MKKICLSGTPMPHSPLDVYAQYRFLDPSIYGWSFVKFRSEYAIMQDYPIKMVVGYKNLDELKEKFYSIAYRVTKDDVLDLPDRVDMVRPFELCPGSRRLYDNLEKDLVAELERGSITIPNALVKLLRLQQITSGFVGLDDDGKIAEVGDGKSKLLSDVMEDIGQDEPIVVFCTFRYDLKTIAEVAGKANRKCFELSGRFKQIDEFKDMGQRGQVLACQIQSGSLGIDLTISRYAVYYSTGFNGGNYQQSRDRLHRPGQTRNVTYIHLIAKDTVDERVMNVLESKRKVVSDVLDKDRLGQDVLRSYIKKDLPIDNGVEQGKLSTTTTTERG